jgi:hypothetical protein
MQLFQQQYSYNRFSINFNKVKPEDTFSNRMYVRQEGQYLILDNECYPSRFKVFQDSYNETGLIDFTILSSDVSGNISDDDSIRFNLWENSYDDYVLPGKIEKININTGMRNAEYYIDKDPSIEIITFDSKRQKDLAAILTEGLAIDDNLNNLYHNYLMNEFFKQDSETLGIIFERTSISDMLCYFIWYFRYRNGKKTYFKPMCYEGIPLNSKKRDWEYWNIRDMGKIYNFTDDYLSINRFMVYSKLEPDKIFFCKGEGEAQALLADLKFSNSIPLLPCGLSVFEDYYYMCIGYYEMRMNYVVEPVIQLSKPSKLVRELKDRLLTSLIPLVDRQTKCYTWNR